MTVVTMKQFHAIDGLDENDLAAFSDTLDSESLAMISDFADWEDRLTSLKVELDKDPTLNLAGFYEKLEESQRARNEAVELVSNALDYRAAWENYLYKAERFLRIVKSALSQDLDRREYRNKELHEAAMYQLRPDVFECVYQCEAVLNWIKTRLEAFNAKLDNLESANLNINRQITVTELLTYKGLL